MTVECAGTPGVPAGVAVNAMFLRADRARKVGSLRQGFLPRLARRRVPQPYRVQALAKPRVTAQAVPLRRDGKVDQRRVAEGNRLVQTLERLVEPACGAVQDGTAECHLQDRVEFQAEFLTVE